ncbi:MAG TPA: hypothetical protein VG448_02850 [Solirubrobacterales bacterium]|nr:hypothetical protein [Solirubrobacterales bacterium]
MSKKLITACLALVAFAAFILPASASAANDPQLTSSGSLVPAGTSIIGTLSGGSVVFWNTATNIQQLVCSNFKLDGSVLRNSGSTVEVEVTSYGFWGTGAANVDNGLPECTGSFGNLFFTARNLPFLLKSLPTYNTDEVQLSAKIGNIKFLLGSTTAGECEYETAASIKADTTTGGTEAQITTRDTAAGSGFKLIRGGFLCPESGMLLMTFNMETTSGTKVVVS